jgi:SAM-dependent methyltransferase
LTGDRPRPGANEAQECWRRDWDLRARTVLDPFELVRGEPAARHAPAVLARRSRQLGRFIGDVGGLRVLDVGCGTGAVLATLSEAGLRVGLDLSLEMLRRAVTSLSASGPAFLVNATAVSLPTIGGRFDCTLCMDVLQYLDDACAQHVLSELTRVSRPGARLILHVRNSHSPVGLTRHLAARGRRLLRRSTTMVEYYRPPGWYRSALTGQATLRETFAYGLHPIGVGPSRLLRWSEEVEDLAQRAVFGRSRFGVHQFMRFEIDRN